MSANMKSRTDTAMAIRQLCRSGAITTATSGMAPGFVQANLVVLPSAFADDFLRFCVLNPKPCPVLGIAEKGSPNFATLGEDLDLRTDLPQYLVWQDGQLTDNPNDIIKYWNHDLVAFALGCSFSFEEALLDEGIELRHISQGKNVAMYRTNIDCVSAGSFSGPLVVSMRPMLPQAAIRAIEITARFPTVHGSPVHIGFPNELGIKDIMRPDYGDAVEIREGELPVFWACGVTSQAVLAMARPKLAITHAPGAMLVTDKRNATLAIF